MKILIAIPSCRDWKADFGAALVGLVHKSALEGLDFTVYIMRGASVIPKARQSAVEIAVKGDFTHILFLDDDMSFPPDLLSSLLSRKVDVVGINYVGKNGKNLPLTHGIGGESISSVDRLGIQEVGWIGFGAVLIRLESVKEISAPLFEMRWTEQRKDFIGEDFYFCGKVRAHGVKVHVDHDVSQKIGHVGDYTFSEVSRAH